MKSLAKLALLLACIQILSAQIACSQSGGQGESNLQSQPITVTSKAGALTKQWTGLLTRKGSEPGIWWALNVNGDGVYRLEGVEEVVPGVARTLQNHAALVTGRVTGNYLSMPIVTVEALTLNE